MDLSKHLDKAAEAVKRRNYGFAIQLYSQLLGIQPANGPARAGLREALFKKAEQKGSSKVFALLLGGPSLLIAKICSLTKQHGAAASAYERYLKLDPLAEGANLALARSLAAAGYDDGALAVYRAYAEHEPRCLEASRMAGRMLAEAGELDAALEMVEQALKVDPRDQESVRLRKNLAAEGALKKSGLESAKSSRDVMRDAEGQRRQERASRMQLSAEEIEEEVGELETKLQTEPEDLGALKRLAELHVMRRDLVAALDCLEAAAGFAPDDPDLAGRVGDMRLRVQEDRVRQARERGDEAAAEQCQRVLNDMRVGEFRRRVERQPSDLGLRFELGSSLLESGDDEGAIAELQRAVDDPRRQIEARMLLGRAFRNRGLADLAQKQLSQALEVGGRDGRFSKEILYELGAAAEDAGDSAAALGHFQEILEKDFGFRDVADRVERLRAS